MIHITDELVAAHTSATEVQQALRAAFLSFGRGTAALQERVRTQANDVKLSTLGAVLPEQGFVGAKVYTTINGQFQFVILLFSANDGRPLATLDAAAITRLRTAATTVLAAQALAPRGPQTLAVFGAGQQGTEHVHQLCAAFDIDRVLLVDPYALPTKASALARECGRPVTLTHAEDAVASAGMIVTASRSAHPLFPGSLVRTGTFIAAIGSSLPHTRELDDEALRRAGRVVVDWKHQAIQEAGDLVLADPECLPDAKVVELAAVLSGPTSAQSRGDITIYKSVGIGLQDIAIAGLAYTNIVGLPT
ncbi:ornithine cyclodeaminase family protein [Bordetella genomosp. 5]|uniref:Ornithine cyclodeaminase n=1 Tax=Bordetella genomosp. 5 TaxID=1395608 RepID=A0A261TWI3_9BORD|nr:ornithine cyclodeaminase family protein [Bordetella genomosp. 5]OZI53627.1 ornithine cyclodeaminase [Bordetella genomosp. 5]